MERREQYKRLIMFLASAFIMGVQTGLFAYVWFHHYNDRAIIGVLYWYRGNWALIGLYAVILFLFLKVFGGFKVGYLRVVEVLFSQVISVLFTNGIAYLQLALIGHWKFLDHIGPMIWLTCVEVLAVFLWIVFMRWIYSRIYPPRNMLFIYGDHSPVELMEKISSRTDRPKNWYYRHGYYRKTISEGVPVLRRGGLLLQPYAQTGRRGKRRCLSAAARTSAAAGNYLYLPE